MRRRRNLILGLIMVSILAGLAIFIASCCEDCPTCPGPGQPYRGWLYAGDFEHGWVYMIDIETDSIIDSANYETERTYTPSAMDVSSDGCYLAVGYYSILLDDRFTRIYDAQTLDVITDLPDLIMPIFVADENLLLGIAYGIKIYSIPDFTLVHEDSMGLSAIADLDKERSLVYVVGHTNESGPESTFVYAYDYIDRQKIDQWYIRDSQNDLANIGAIDIDSEGRCLYCITGSGNDGSRVACYDLIERKILFWCSIYSQTGSLKLSPDDKEIYVTDPGYFNDINAPGIVYVFNADDGSYINGISLYGYDPSIVHPLYASPIVFTPSGEKAYIGSGRIEKRSGTISVIDTKTRDIVKNIWPDLGHFIWQLKVGPKL